MSYEQAAIAAIKEALESIVRASELSERAGYRNQVIIPLANAQREAQYALDTALGRN